MPDFYAAVAEVYDEWYSGVDATEAVGYIGSLLEGDHRTLLEVGVGTGRLAIPLAEAGLTVTGLDPSPAMLSVLRAKAPTITVIEGGFLEAEINETYDVVLCAFNTLYSALHPEEQLKWFERAQALLKPGGSFIIETWVPDLPIPEGLQLSHVGETELVLKTTAHDSVRQHLVVTYIRSGAGGVSTVRVPQRYVHVNELAVMARLSGFEEVVQSGGWSSGSPVLAGGMMVTRCVR